MELMTSHDAMQYGVRGLGGCVYWFMEGETVFIRH